MIKKILIAALLLALFLLGYYFFNTWQRSHNLSLWRFVPMNAALVYESDQIGSVLLNLKESQLARSLTMVPIFNKMYREIEKIDSLTGGNSFYAFANNLPVLVTIQNTSKSKFDFLFLAQIDQFTDRKGSKEFLEKLIKPDGQKSKRNYFGFEVNEIETADNDHFTYFIYENYFIGSFTPYLVEDAIRAQVTIESFETQFPEHRKVTKIKQDEGNLYINYPELITLSRAFTENELNPNFLNKAFLDLGISDHSISLSGFSFADSSHQLNRIKGITGAPFDMSDIISNNTSIFHHFSFSDPQLWISQQGFNTEVSSKKENIIKDLGFDPYDITRFLDQEIGLAFQYRNGQLEPLMILESNNSIELMNHFDAISKQMPHVAADSFFIEIYNEQIINKLPIDDFPVMILGDLAKDFPEAYYTSYQDYVLIASKLPLLKDVINDINNENTWEKSLKKKRFLEKITQEASYTILVNTAESWSQLYPTILPELKKEFYQFDYIFKSLENIALQFSSVDDKYFTSLLIEQATVPKAPESNVIKTKVHEFNKPLITKPFLVRDAPGAKIEIIVEDEANILHLLNEDFELRWSKSIFKPIVGELTQIDFYKNGKLQYLFITADSVYLVDRNGENVEEYPKYIASNLSALAIVDYDGKKNYRFAITTLSGDLFITDQQGTPLEGWDPYHFSASIIGSVRHFRVGGTDAFAIVLTNGEMHLISRRGKVFPGFPIQTNMHIQSDYHLQVGSKFETSKWTVLSESGTLLSVNLKGTIIDRKELYKPRTDSKFQIHNDLDEKNYLISKQFENSIAVVNNNDAIIFEKNQLSSENVKIQYYKMGGDNDYFILSDLANQLIYPYDLNGRLLTTLPLMGDQPISLRYFKKENVYEIYLIRENKLILYLKK
jgi:hypothetical protein